MLLQNKEEMEKVKSFKERESKEYLGYYRMCFRDGWFGTWMGDTRPYDWEINTLDAIIFYIKEKAPKGMDYEFQSFLKEASDVSPNGRYHFFWTKTNFNYLVEFAPEYGNSDYPVRIYVYRNRREMLHYHCSCCGQDFTTSMGVGIPQGMYYSGCRAVEDNFYCEDCVASWSERNNTSFTEQYGEAKSKRMFTKWWNKETEKQVSDKSKIKKCRQTSTGDFEEIEE